MSMYDEILSDDTMGFIYSIFVDTFKWMDIRDIDTFFAEIGDDVLCDVQETADMELMHSGDVEIAIRRVLFDRLGLNY